jgi:hypothetical protein
MLDLIDASLFPMEPLKLSTQHENEYNYSQSSSLFPSSCYASPYLSVGGASPLLPALDPYILSPPMGYIMFPLDSFPRSIDTSSLLLPQTMNMNLSPVLSSISAVEEIDFDMCFDGTEKKNPRQAQDPQSVLLRSWKSPSGLFNVRFSYVTVLVPLWDVDREDVWLESTCKGILILRLIIKKHEQRGECMFKNAWFDLQGREVKNQAARYECHVCSRSFLRKQDMKYDLLN